MTCPDVERLIDAYSDDELDAAQATEVAEHVAGCPACHEWLAERVALRRLIRSVPYYAAPDRVRRAVAASRRRARVTRQRLAWAAAALVVISLGSGAMIRTVRARQTAATTTALAQDVVASHVRALTDAHLFDVRSSDQHTVKPWFQGKLDFSPPVEDLAPLGFPLVGGRVADIGGQRVAALVYQRRQHTISVFIWPAVDGAGAPADARSFRGFQVRHWTRGAMAFWAVSDLNDLELDQFVHALQG